MIFCSLHFDSQLQRSAQEKTPGRPEGTQWMGPKPWETDEGFLLKELALSLKILEHFRFLAASRKKKQSRRFQQPTKKNLSLQKDSEVSWIFRRGLCYCRCKTTWKRETTCRWPQCPATYAPWQVKGFNLPAEKVGPKSRGQSHVPRAGSGWPTMVNPENPRETYYCRKTWG